jgi:hypothetical protein
MTTSLRDWANELAKHTKTTQVDKDHKPSPGELNNIAYLSMRYLTGWIIQSSDLIAIVNDSGDVETMDDVFENYVPAVAKYIWGHLYGEPENIPQVDVQSAVKAFANLVYTLDEKIRKICSQAPDEVLKEIDKLSITLVDFTGVTAKGILGRFVLKHTKDKKRAIRTLEETMSSYDQTYLNYSVAYEDRKQFRDKFISYLQRLLANIWFSLQILETKE